MKACDLAGLLGVGVLLVNMTASAESWPGGFNPLMSPMSSMSPGMNSFSPLGMGGMSPLGYGMNPYTGYSGMGNSWGNNFSPWNSFGSGANGIPWNMNSMPWGSGNNSGIMPWDFFNGSNYNNSRRNNNDWVGNMFLLEALNGNQLGAGLLPPFSANGINGMPAYAPVYTAPAGQVFTAPVIPTQPPQQPAVPAGQLSPQPPVAPQNFNPFARVAPQPPAPAMPLRQELVFPDGSRF